MLLDKRKNYKPFEYPELNTFVEAINKTFWVHSEVDFTGDKQDFKSVLTDVEKEVLKRSLLSIAQIEVGVKSFWGKLYDVFPKPEINGLGSTFAENEYRHSEAYSRLVDVLGYTGEFEHLLHTSIFQKRLETIDYNLNQTNDIIWKLMYFTVVIENCSLFSLFANILSFTRFKGIMKNTSNIIAWTSVDEQIHAEAGIYLINKYIEEYPESINGKIIFTFIETLKEYIKVEEELLDWIFEKGELDFYSKEDLLNFIKNRVDQSLVKLKLPKIYNVTPTQIKPMNWFEEEIYSTPLDDFFAKRPVDYTKYDKPVTSKDLF